jgi:hypothetical protein
LVSWRQWEKFDKSVFHRRGDFLQAVERFVTVGETIADDNPDIKQDMYEACKEARAAGELKEMMGG